MLGIATTIIAGSDRSGWSENQVTIGFRKQGKTEWTTSLFASDGADGVDAVLNGRARFAILNPATAIGRILADRNREGEVAAVCTIPSYDQLGFAVDRRLEIVTLDELADRSPAIRLSLRGNRPNHSVHLVVDTALAAAGTSLTALTAAGASIRYDEGHGHGIVRAKAMREGHIDALFDEGIYNWIEAANDAGFVFLSMGERSLEALERSGLRRAVLSKARYPFLDRDVITVDFSGFLVFTHVDTDDAIVRTFCEAILASKDRIPWQGGQELPLDRMVNGAIDAPLPLPFHPAAERVWRQAGLI
jgi:hypothetical protein